MKIAEMSATLVDSMGTDLSVVNAARVSFAKESDWEEDMENGSRVITYRLSDKDGKLINYLAKHNHITPFMHCFATFRMKAPIFVARQLVKHQIGLSWNEESRRYIDEEPEFWIPKVWRARPEGSIKQGSGTGEIKNPQFYGVDYGSSGGFDQYLELCLLGYERLLKQGVAPEQARMVLPLNTMTNWIWSGSLAAWARVANLRLDPHAQLECQMAVKPIAEQCEQLWPVSWKALTKSN